MDMVVYNTHSKMHERVQADGTFSDGVVQTMFRTIKITIIANGNAQSAEVQ